MSELIEQLKKEIIQELNLQDLSPEEFDAHTPLFVEGLGLDSIDALELIVLLQKNYGLKLSSAEEGKKIFQSVKTMADFIEESRKKQA